MSEASQKNGGNLPEVVMRRVVNLFPKPGCEAAYEAMVLGMFEAVKKYPGFLGSELLPPIKAGASYQVIVKFASKADLSHWDHSMDRKIWNDRIKIVADGEPEFYHLTGLEAWFSLPEVPTGKKPSRWKMALVTWFGIWPTVSVLILLLDGITVGWPYLIKTALITSMVVVIMTYILMPRLTSLFRQWLTD